MSEQSLKDEIDRLTVANEQLKREREKLFYAATVIRGQYSEKLLPSDLDILDEAIASIKESK